MKIIFNCISFFCASLLIAFRPLLGPAVCKFEPTCTKFALICLKEKSLLRALWEIAKRLLRCNPFN